MTAARGRSYLLGLGLVLKEHLEEGGGERGVGQQGERGGGSQEACTRQEVFSSFTIKGLLDPSSVLLLLQTHLVCFLESEG